MKTIGLIDERIIKNNLINLKNIVFEVTEKCNLNCKYCGLSEQLYQKYDVRKSRDLPFKKARLMIDYLLNLWRDNYTPDTNLPLIMGFYGGEPLLNMSLIKKIIDYVERSDTAGRQIYYAMTTNAMLLDKYMDFLAEKKFYLTVSLDGDETAQSYRIDRTGNNSYNQVIHNVKLLQRTYPEYFNGQHVNFISVLHNRNDVEPILDFFKAHFNKTPKISPLGFFGIREDKKDEFRKIYQNISQSLIKSTNCETIEDEYFLEMPKGLRLSKFLYHTSGNIYYNYNQLLMQKFGNNKISTGTCLPFSKKLFVATDGKILPCERIDHDFEVGYVHDDFVELDYKHVAERHNYYLSKSADQCICCAANAFCYQCVYHIDDIRNKSPHCPNFCTPEIFDKEKEQNFSYLRERPHYYEKVLTKVSFTL
ncbi:MAG: radical SAM peptide maturase [Bacteroidales bacterium]|jgi:uncharacterized protein|nr:radical SAM peptide maturase [Bacteroidales bacterium]